MKLSTVFFVIALALVSVSTAGAQSVCEGLNGAAFGLCTAYCEAMECDSTTPHASPQACQRVGGRFEQLTGAPPPCVQPLQYFYTCGDPVCHGGLDDPSIPNCAGQNPGDPCTVAGATCELLDGCNTRLVCALTDPTAGGCPISRGKFKTGVEYLSADEVQRLHDEVLRVRLATWRYRAPELGDRRRLGFIIEDVEPSLSVDSARDMVDLYGYTSMAVAALQAQARQIRALEEQVKQLRNAAADPGGPR